MTILVFLVRYIDATFLVLHKPLHVEAVFDAQVVQN